MKLYIDCETTGLNPRTDKLALVQYKIDNQPTQLIQAPTLNEVHALLDSADTIIGHNLSFDFAFLKYIPKSIDHFEDTLYLDRVANFAKEHHSLDAVAERVYGRDVYAKHDKKRLQKTKWGTAELTQEQLEYAALDVDILPTIYEHLLRIFPTYLKGVYNFDKKSIIAGLTIQLNGLPILHEGVSEEIDAVDSQAYRIRSLIAPLNPNSPKQVTEKLGIDSSGDRVLAELEADGNTLAKQIREVRGHLKYLNFLEKLSTTPRFYGTLQPAARSGRFTSSKENLQNLPRDTKKFIGSHKNVIISADFAQLELRTIAAITGDETMCRLFIEGEDLHNYAAATLYGKDFTKTQRQIAKVFNFSCLYGAGAATIGQMLLTQTGIKLPEHEVKEHKRKWLAAFSGIAEWQRQGSTRHEMGEPNRTPHGRPYVSQRFTDHLSIQNQGAGAEVARIALHYILEHLPPEAKLINFVHDSYLVEAPKLPSVYKAAAQVLYDGMKYAWDKAPLDRRGIEMPVSVGVAHNWKDADSLTNCVYVMGDEI